MTVGDLFSGIGGFRLGLERAGHEIKWACEIDDFCRRVYLKHWPDTKPFYKDIRDVQDPPYVDMLCGGFPCQDLSLAGKQAGIDGSRSGLWSEFARLIRTVRPRFALVENVPGLLVHGMERVLGDLAALGYDAEWECIPAAAVGAPHIRDRVWILAYSGSARMEKYGTLGAGIPQRSSTSFSGTQPKESQTDVAYANRGRFTPTFTEYNQGPNDGSMSSSTADLQQNVADAERKQDHRERGIGKLGRIALERGIQTPQQNNKSTGDDCTNRCGQDVADADNGSIQGIGSSGIKVPRSRCPEGQPQGRSDETRGQWATEPDVGRVAHGVPNRVDRLKSLGNAVVPQVVEWIGRRIGDAVRDA